MPLRSVAGHSIVELKQTTNISRCGGKTEKTSGKGFHANLLNQHQIKIRKDA